MDTSTTVNSQSAAADCRLEVQNLSKKFKVYRRLRHVFWELVTGRRLHDEVWALRNVSLSVGRGEIAAIIGRNGAGKSTLLRILAGTLDFTSGSVRTSGSVASIFELGTGFHPDYTGRENIFLGGMCLGLSREAVADKLEEIAAFSELGDVLDHPFKTYSSGMQARLTFATAVSVSPDVFLIDEALAVGDVLFQEKCFRRIREIAARGATVLFVTHAYPLIYDLCSRAFLLHHGTLVVDGTPRQVGYAYEKLLAEERSGKPIALSVGAAGSMASRPDAQIVSIEAQSLEGSSVTALFHGQEYRVVMRATLAVDISALSLGFILQKPTGAVIYSVATAYLGVPLSGHAGDTIEVQFSFSCLLASGSYLLSGGVSRLRGELDYDVLHTYRDAGRIDVVSSNKFGGDVDLQSRVVSVKQVAAG